MDSLDQAVVCSGRLFRLFFAGAVRVLMVPDFVLNSLRLRAPRFFSGYRSES